MSDPPTEPGLFDGVLAAGAVRAEVSDTAWLQAMLDVEAAIVHAQAEVGLVSADIAERVAAACRASAFDVAELARGATAVGNPAAPLVRALVARLDDEAAARVHYGATSQDVVDSAAMLVAHRATRPLLTDLRKVAARLATLTGEHAHTLQVGRTLLQQAQPVTFGLVTAGWLVGVDDATDRLAEVRDERLAAQFGGATGTLAAYGDDGAAVHAAVARRLHLAEPVLPWHTTRTRVAELAGALATVCGTVATIARDVTLLAQTEVAEVREAGPDGAGGSSAMPHKQNPVAATAALGSARQAPGLAATLYASMEQEHERAAGAWHAEWRPFTELLRCTGSAVAWLATSLDRLHVDAHRMRANLDATGGVLLAERVTAELADHTGRLAAHDAVTRCCRQALDGGTDLVDVLAADPVVGAHLDRGRLAELLDPTAYVGSAAAFAKRALDAHHGRASS